MHMDLRSYLLILSPQMFTVYKEKLQLGHVDTTNFSVHGEYENGSSDGCIKITKGHQKISDGTSNDLFKSCRKPTWHPDICSCI